MSDSRISGLYKLSVSDRINELEKLGWLSTNAVRDLLAGRQVISAVAADKMIENVVGVFGLPLAIAPNFVVNKRECIVPLVVEEPSIVAALSSAAALARDLGGFSATLEESLLAGQIHVVGVADAGAAIAQLSHSGFQSGHAIPIFILFPDILDHQPSRRVRTGSRDRAGSALRRHHMKEMP